MVSMYQSICSTSHAIAVFEIDTLGTFTMCQAAFNPEGMIGISMTLHGGPS